MTEGAARLGDAESRSTAITAHSRSMLVEAGAGTGKTAVMAGRIAMMLAGGVSPRSVAAVTFTELAASQLLERVRDFTEELLAERIPIELRAVLPTGLSEAQKANLVKANSELDEITCSTIHGFCQRLITPYPVEARIDPGATVMNRPEADRLFDELLDIWLRACLGGADGTMITEIVVADPNVAVQLITQIAQALRRGRVITAPDPQPVGERVDGFLTCVGEFSKFMESCPVDEPETKEIARSFEGMAKAIGRTGASANSASLVALVNSQAEQQLCRKADGGFLAYRKKGKWQAAAKAAGLSKADGDRLHDQAELHYKACGDAWNTMREAAATHVLSGLVAEVRPLIERFQEEKRRTALLDFDDLIFAARGLLREHDSICQALAARYSFVLVDEFQDTDPLQAEIFWRLCSEPAKTNAEQDWQSLQIRPGALFLVGDPKQAIYRFRGADVNAYLQAREALGAQDPKSIIQISTNFRSEASILNYVNDRFETPFSAAGQPGFTPLEPFHAGGRHSTSVVALDVELPAGDGNINADKMRDGEADAVAELCRNLIGQRTIIDRKTGETRTCRAGDIALLAPTGSDLWRYEEALEERDISVSTQAGKGFFRRQEVQDLIALTRVLADSRDTLALGALLRGPLVGLTEEELLDITWSLPRPPAKPDRLQYLRRSTAPQNIANPLARDALSSIQSLTRKMNSTTPHQLLSQAVDALRVRPILLQRHHGHAERALANVDRFLDLARVYRIRGLRAFSDAMTQAWTDNASVVEGRPDVPEESVSLYTMHAAKGLEWPVVVPINAMTKMVGADPAVLDRETSCLHCPVFGISPSGYEQAHTAEVAELTRERIRLWYVATTRARDLLVLPRLPADPPANSWLKIVDLAFDTLPAYDLSKGPTSMPGAAPTAANEQTKETFAAEAAAIAGKSTRVEWLAPSRGEDVSEPLLAGEKPEVFATNDDVSPLIGEATTLPTYSIQGGKERGLILHKLLEEVLNGEVCDEHAALTQRADELVRSFGREPHKDPAKGLSPSEIADSVNRALCVPQIAAVRAKLVPEYSVYASNTVDGVERITAGIADAIAIGDGGPELIVDWKSDVTPDSKAIEGYRAQVRSYLEVTAVPEGFIVFATTGRIVEVTNECSQRYRSTPLPRG